MGIAVTKYRVLPSFLPRVPAVGSPCPQPWCDNSWPWHMRMALWAQGSEQVGGCFLLPLQYPGRHEHASTPFFLTSEGTWHGERLRENIQVPISKISKHHAAATVDDLGELTFPGGRNLAYLVQSHCAQHQKNSDRNVKLLQCRVFLVFFI